MSSSTEIANLAISQLGLGKTISDLDTERSLEANACRRFYDIALKIILSQFDWPFASKQAALALVEDFTLDEDAQWNYSYQYPSDCVNFRYVLTPGVRNTNIKTRVPHRIFQDPDNGQVIYTDMVDAIGEYTVLIDTVDSMPYDFRMAFACLLASYIAPQIVSGDNRKIAADMWNLYQFHASHASTRNANEQIAEDVPPSEFMSARHGNFSNEDDWRFRR